MTGGYNTLHTPTDVGMVAGDGGRVVLRNRHLMPGLRLFGQFPRINPPAPKVRHRTPRRAVKLP